MLHISPRSAAVCRIPVSASKCRSHLKSSRLLHIVIAECGTLSSRRRDARQMIIIFTQGFVTVGHMVQHFKYWTQKERQTHKDGWTDGRTGRHTRTHTQTERQTDIQIDRQTDGHSEGQTDRETDRQTDRQGHSSTMAVLAVYTVQRFPFHKACTVPVTLPHCLRLHSFICWTGWPTVMICEGRAFAAHHNPVSFSFLQSVITTWRTREFLKQ
jgi:hypothetical protein